MFFYTRRALQDFNENRFLHVVTTLTIALSILIASAAGLLFLNLNGVVSSWKSGVRIMAYMVDGTDQATLTDVEQSLKAIQGISSIRFIPREEALSILKAQMKNRASILENIDRNPLPDAFEIRMNPETQNWDSIEVLASHIKSTRHVSDVEYGKAWFGRVTNIFNLMQFAGVAMMILFSIVTVFIISNTIRLALYARKEEIEIMRLVGATSQFIKLPSYITGLIQGAIGGLAGITLLFIGFLAISSKLAHNFSSYGAQIRFLPAGVVFAIIFYSIFVGWLGCFLSINQFLKQR